MKEGIIIGIVTLGFFFTILFWRDISGAFGSNGKTKGVTSETGKKSKNKKDTDVESSSGTVRVVKRWDLPKELTEISGLTALDNDRLACIQDETGTVYIYNVTTSSVEREVPFSGTGDFEGITWTGKSMYVIRADGQLFKIDNFNDKKPVVKEYKTGLTVKNNIESLGYDEKNNRLLLTGKDPDPSGNQGKEIYAFDLASEKLIQEPAMTIDLAQIQTGPTKKSGGGFQPSSLSVHPTNGDIYITDGPKGNLVILDGSGKVKELIALGTKEFPQAEGVTFNDSGQMYISTEGKKDPGAIMLVELGK